MNVLRRLARFGLALALALALAGAGVAFAAEEQPLLMLEQGAHSAPVRRIDVHPGRGVAVTASDDRTARVWDLASGELRHVLRPLAFGAEGGRLYAAAIHPSLPLVAVAGTTGGDGHAHRIYLFDLDSGALARSIDAQAGDIRRLVWTADGTLLLAGYTTSNGWRAFTAEGRQVFDERLAAPVFGVAVSKNGLAAVVGIDGRLRTYRAAAGTVTALADVQVASDRTLGVAFSPDGRQVAVTLADSREVQLLEAETGRPVAKLPAPQMFGGFFSVVAWSADGRALHVAGTTHSRDLVFPIVRYDVASRRIDGETFVARDSVTDLVALPDGGVAYSSFDGSWGSVTGAGVVRRIEARIARALVPEDLELSDDARSLRWGAQGAQGGFAFGFAQRKLQTGGGPALRTPETRFSLLDAPSDWNLARGSPLVGGKRLALAQDERSRALVVMRATKSAAIGTNRALYKLSEQGDVLWRKPVDTEVRAVNASADGRWIVSALADGTLRWWRARDGAHVLSLYASADGRWVLWTPSGYYDASAGADRLVGWALGRGQERAMEFHSLARFRDRFSRPDVIDRLLAAEDERVALDALAAEAQAAQLAAARDAEARQQKAQSAAREAAAQGEQARLAAAREADARQAAEAAAREAVARAKDLQLAEARRAASRQQAEREAAERDAAQRREEARRAAAAEVRAKEEAQEAARVAAQRKAAEEAAARVAAAEAVAAKLAAEEASAREAAAFGRKARAAIKATEFPPALSASAAKRIKLSGAEVTLPFAISSAGGRAELVLEVRVNGRPAEPLELVVPASLDGAARGLAKLRVGEGESLVEVIARNAHGVSEPLAFTIERAAAAQRPEGDLYVLAIGVADYAREQYRLNLAAKDARDFAEAMKSQQGKLYRRVIVRTLTDRDATRANISREFEWLRSTATPADVAMLFVAGHGLNDANGQYYFLPWEAQHERLASTAIPQSAIVSTLSKIRGKTLFFVDTCFAGNTLGALREKGRHTERMMNDLSASENGVVVFASSTGYEEAEEKSDWGNGAFTKALIDGLAGKADFTRAGRVTYAALNLFVSEEVSRITDGRQRPVFISPRGIPDFALVRL